MKHTVQEIQAQIMVFRKHYEEGTLTEDEVKTLEAIPGWTWGDKGIRKPGEGRGFKRVVNGKIQ